MKRTGKRVWLPGSRKSGRRRGERRLKRPGSLTGNPPQPPFIRGGEKGAGRDGSSSARSFRPRQPPLKNSVQYVKGVGPRRAEQLARLGIATVEDLLYHIPFRYQDRREIKNIRDLQMGDETAVSGQIARMERRFLARRRRWVLEAVVRDETGFLFLLWYHQHRYFQQRYQLGQRSSSSARWRRA